MGGFRIGTIAGVELAVDWSLLIIVGLITLNLGAGVFPLWHPEWGALMCWGLGFLAALLLVASIAAHELSHALVGRKQGISIRRITLFVFGGVAHMEGEPPAPRAELWMVLVGPITSFLIGVLATAIGLALSTDAAARYSDDPVGYAAALGPGATLLLWLGPLNILLALFNMLPGFPLDGGRVLRAFLWWSTGDREKATRWSAYMGQLLGWTLMALGVMMAFGLFVPILGGGLVQGLWLLLLGWFLSNAARYSYEQVLIRESLTDVSISTLMRERVDSVPPEMSVDELARDHIMVTDQTSFPVVRDDTIVGMVTTVDLRRAPREQWLEITVADIMTPISEVPVVHPWDEATAALPSLTEYDQVPVVDGNRLVGVARRADVIKWVSLH